MANRMLLKRVLFPRRLLSAPPTLRKSFSPQKEKPRTFHTSASPIVPPQQQLAIPIDWTKPALPRDEISSLVSTRLSNHSLPAHFYRDEGIFKADVNNVWKKNWLFAAFTAQIPKPGDFVTYQVGNESVIIVHGDNDRFNAFYNVCRHRGSRICSTESGRAKKFVCPYHGWTYSHDGNLVKANYMDQPNFRPEEHGLHKVHIQEIWGMLFICLADDPPDFAEGFNRIAPEIKPHRLDKAKVAHVENYDIHANWKLVYENNRECYHCNIGHPEYIRSNYDTSYSYSEGGRVVDPSHPRKQEIEEHVKLQSDAWKAFGLQCSTDSSFPGSGWYRASRTPLRKGWVTESLDGTPVSTLMGEFTDRNMGSCRIHTLPNFWMHASSDHAVSTRLTPVHTTLTKAQVIWLVDERAEEGKDYQLDKLLPFWKLTSEQDWKLCEENQLGINSEKYRPGPFSDKKEAGVEKFILWYLRNLNR